jgi:hypothetical protein
MLFLCCLCVCHAFVTSLLRFISYACLLDPTLPPIAVGVGGISSVLSPPHVLASASVRASTPCPCLCCAISSAPCCVARVCPPPCCCEVMILSALCPGPPPSHTVSAQAYFVGLLAIAPPSCHASTRRAVPSRFMHKRQLSTITAEAIHWLF